MAMIKLRQCGRKRKVKSALSTTRCFVVTVVTFGIIHFVANLKHVYNTHIYTSKICYEWKLKRYSIFTQYILYVKKRD